jgi:hypothetical protein
MKKAMMWMALFCATKGFGQTVKPFGCSGAFYVTYGTGSAPNSGQSIDKVLFNNGQLSGSLVKTISGMAFNGADINPVDGYMYGVRYVTAAGGLTPQIIRIDSLGNWWDITNNWGPAKASNWTYDGMGSPYPAGESSYAACFDANGDFYISNAPAIGDEPHVYKIDVNVPSSQSPVVTDLGSTGMSISLSESPLLVDIAIDPTTGIMYGATSSTNSGSSTVSNNAFSLVTISKTTGLATPIGKFSYNGVTNKIKGFGLFFTEDGTLYMYANPIAGSLGTDPSPFFKVNKTDASLTLVGSGAPYRFADGCGCSFRIAHQLSVPAQLCATASDPTPAFNFGITLINSAGSAKNNVNFDLLLDPHFSFTQSATVIKPYLVGLGMADATTLVTVSSSGGTNNKISITGLIVPYSGQGSTTNFTLSAQYLGGLILPVSFQSTLTNLPGDLGGIDHSDDPATNILKDSSTITFCAAPLAVRLIDFSATKKNQSIQLNWQTATEQNAGWFEIERSQDGNAFASIAQIKAVGNATLMSNYSFEDGNPLAGTNYYRLKMVDLDGSVSYSKTVSVLFTGVQQAGFEITGIHAGHVYYNATTDINAHLIVRNIAGATVLAASTLLQKGSGDLTIEGFSNLADGMYMLQLTSDKGYSGFARMIK